MRCCVRRFVSEVYQCRGEIELSLSYAGLHTRPLSAQSVGWSGEHARRRYRCVYPKTI